MEGSGWRGGCGQNRGMQELRNWSTRAVNLPEHSGNAIHTDEGAREKGFDAALVAGVTVYAYLTHLPVAAWGIDWVRSGGAHVRFHAPVLDGDAVDCVVAGPSDGQVEPEGAASGTLVEAQVDGAMRARCEMFPAAAELPTRNGEPLAPIEFELGHGWIDYGIRAGDDERLYTDVNIAHPAAWMAIANRLFHEQVVTGPWIHVRSFVAHHGVARLGSTIDADAVVVERFDTRAGRRAIADVRIRADGELVASLEHEAIIEVR